MENDNRLRVGVITSPHGVHGEVNVFPTTDDPQRFKKLKKVYIYKKKETLECNCITTQSYFLPYLCLDKNIPQSYYRQC